MWGIAYLYPLLHSSGLRRIRHHNTGKPDPWHHLVMDTARAQLADMSNFTLFHLTRVAAESRESNLCDL
jgi:hypothetical protein